VRMLYSSRSLEDVIYRTEFDDTSDGVEVIHTLTREQPAGWTGYARRVDAALLGEVAWPATQEPIAFVCGPTSFVETVASGLVELGYRPDREHRAATAFGVDVLPAAFLVADGRLIARFAGARDWSSKEMRRLLVKLASERTAARAGRTPGEG